MVKPRDLFHGPWGLSVALVVMALGTGANHESGVGWLAVLLAVGALLPVVLNGPPVALLLASGAMTGGYFAAGYGDGPIFLALPAVTFVAAFRSAPKAWPWPAAAAAGLAVLGLVLRPELHGPVDAPASWQALGLVALTAAAGAVATVVRSRRDVAAERARNAANEERLRTAADLHDGVGHGLAVIAMQAGAALHVFDSDPASAREGLEVIRATSRESLDALRSELARLSGDEAPRMPAPGLAELPALVDRVRGGGLDVNLKVEVGGPLPEEVGRVAYVIAQEGLTNVLRHAAATRAEVAVGRDGASVVVTVSDDGKGPVASAEEPRTGMGLAGMRARVERLGGTLDAGPEATGFRVRATIPVPAGVVK